MTPLESVRDPREVWRDLRAAEARQRNEAHQSARVVVRLRSPLAIDMQPNGDALRVLELRAELLAAFERRDRDELAALQPAIAPSKIIVARGPGTRGYDAAVALLARAYRIRERLCNAAVDRESPFDQDRSESGRRSAPSRSARRAASTMEVVV